MRELIVTPGDDIREVFLKAWQLYHKLKGEPVCFQLNYVRVIIITDDSHATTRILTNEEAKKIVEQNKESF